jgi:hypothetical protein
VPIDQQWSSIMWDIIINLFYREARRSSLAGAKVAGA